MYQTFNEKYEAARLKHENLLVIRAQQAWLYLIAKAFKRETCFYGDLVIRLMGYPTANLSGKILDYIMCYCQQNQLSPLSILVQNQEIGRNGIGFTAAGSIEEVYEFNWFNVVPPSADELIAARMEVRKKIDPNEHNETT